MPAFLLAIFLLLDWYVFQGLRILTSSLGSEFFQPTIHAAFWAVSLSLPLLLGFSMVKLGVKSPLFKTASSLFLTLLITKLFFVVVLMGGDLVRVAEGGIRWISKAGIQEGFLPERRMIVSQLALGVAVVPFASFLYGIIKGKYNFKIHRHTLYFDDLPEAFHGFTITQISDIHCGSFDNADAVRRGVDLVKAQNSDMVVFTGDLVNHTACEFDSWVEVFKNIRAPFGQFSILGNHDYGDYDRWPSVEAKKANFSKLKQHHASIGFRLLLDEGVEIEKDGEKIALLGVENWGIGFGQRGNLNKAMQNISGDAFKILLSHDPSHWDAEAKNWPSIIHLTLSGHTHGMQLGMEIPGLRWSPVKYRYPKWAGIYEESGKYLNVNRGFGFHGFSGRVGIWPEITVLELRKKEA